MDIHPPTIPAAIEQQAIQTIDAMAARGLTHPHKVTSTCRSIAIVVLSKWNEGDKKAIATLTRMLTNRMVAHAYEKEGI
jgi:hypothetical protein